MTPPDVIRADYPTLERVATTFDDEHDRVQRILESMARHVESLKGGGWVSDAAESFYREMDEDLLPSLERLKTALGAAGETTRRIVQIMRQAEQEAAAVMRGTDEAPVSNESMGLTTSATGVTPVGTSDDPLETDDGKLRVRYSPLFQETTLETPIPASEDQLTALAELGIVVPDDGSVTADEAQAVLDFYAAHPGLLAEGMTLIEVQEAITIVDRMTAIGLSAQLSDYHPKAWSISDLRLMNETISQMSQTAHAQFIAQFENPEAALAALERIAAEMGLENTDDAALRLFVSPEGDALAFYRDAGVNVYDNVTGDAQDDTVGYTDPNANTTEVYRAYSSRIENGQGYTIIYDPETYEVYDVYGQAPEGYTEQIDGTEFVTSNTDIRNTIITNTTRNARFFGWAYADGIILADNTLMMTGTQDAFAGDFTAQGLIAHEVGHIVDFDNQGLSNILGTDTSGLENEARTSGSADEVQADIISNGLLGTITDPAQQANFDAYIAQIYNQNFEALTGASMADFEASFEQIEATPEATETPSDPEATPTPPNI